MIQTNTQHLKDWLKTLTPKHHCLLCASTSADAICQHCKPYFDSPLHRCQQCAIPLPVSIARCGECLSSPPAFDEVVAPFLYQPPLNKLIHDFKHKHDLVVGKALSRLFCHALLEQEQQHGLTRPQWILASPLHWRRQWQRGFNQAAFFSLDLSQCLNIPVFTGLKKQQFTPSQEGLSRKQRLKNLSTSFYIDQPLNGESVAIVDDVMTTGATANSLARALKKAGAGKISIWVLARTPKKGSPRQIIL